VKLYGVFPSSRGLIRIFTYTTISPCPLLRQYPNHYAIRAGRNLPDKEFRYLRTVIVTAAVHWGLSSMLPGQASAPIRHLSISQRPVFLVNSCLDLFTVATSLWHPFSRSYGVILPSSLTRVLTFVLEFSSRLPVSVCGTGTYKYLAAFLASVDSSTSLLYFTPVCAKTFRHTYFTICHPAPTTSISINLLRLSSCVTASLTSSVV